MAFGGSGSNGTRERVQQAGAVEAAPIRAPPPTELPAPGWLNVFKRIWHSFSEDRILALAAGVAFYGLLALFPAIGSLVALYGFVLPTPVRSPPTWIL